MDIRKLQRAIVDGLEDVKAHDIVVLNTEHLSALFERVIIASGASNRQTKALASSVRESVKSRGLQVLATEGEANGEWIVVDCGAAVAHIMQPAIRDYYRLEEIWGGKSVRMKVGEVRTSLPKASEPTASGPARKAVAQKPATTKPAGKKATARKPALNRADARQVPAAKRPAARKTVQSQAAAGQPGPSKTAPRKATQSKAAPRKAVAARKSPRTR